MPVVWRDCDRDARNRNNAADVARPAPRPGVAKTTRVTRANRVTRARRRYGPRGARMPRPGTPLGGRPVPLLSGAASRRLLSCWGRVAGRPCAGAWGRRSRLERGRCGPGRRRMRTVPARRRHDVAGRRRSPRLPDLRNDRLPRLLEPGRARVPRLRAVHVAHRHDDAHATAATGPGSHRAAEGPDRPDDSEPETGGIGARAAGSRAFRGFGPPQAPIRPGDPHGSGRRRHGPCGDRRGGARLLVARRQARRTVDHRAAFRERAVRASGFADPQRLAHAAPDPGGNATAHTGDAPPGGNTQADHEGDAATHAAPCADDAPTAAPGVTRPCGFARLLNRRATDRGACMPMCLAARVPCRRCASV